MLDRSRPVLVLCNASSGRGRAETLASTLAHAIERAGWTVERLHIGPANNHRAAEASREFEHAAPRAAAIVIAGGDGTVHHCLPVLLASRTPMYHAPSGTENLHAREIGSSASPLRLVAALEAGVVRDIDCATCNDVPLAIMTSVGFDAAVVQRVAEARSGAVRKLSYVVQGLRAMAGGIGPGNGGVSVPISITIDGVIHVTETPGMVVVCNNPRYGGQFDPADRASLDDGLLDVVFIPFNTRARLVAWGAIMKCRMHASHRDLVYATGREIVVESSWRDAPWQVDGEWPTSQRASAIRDGRLRLDIRVMPGALRVLAPAAP